MFCVGSFVETRFDCDSVARSRFVCFSHVHRFRSCGQIRERLFDTLPSQLHCRDTFAMKGKLLPLPFELLEHVSQHCGEHRMPPVVRFHWQHIKLGEMFFVAIAQGDTDNADKLTFRATFRHNTGAYTSPKSARSRRIPANQILPTHPSRGCFHSRFYLRTS